MNAQAACNYYRSTRHNIIIVIIKCVFVILRFATCCCNNHFVSSRIFPCTNVEQRYYTTAENRGEEMNFPSFYQCSCRRKFDDSKKRRDFHIVFVHTSECAMSEQYDMSCRLNFVRKNVFRRARREIFALFKRHSVLTRQRVTGTEGRKAH